MTSTSINGGIHAEPKVGNRDRERTRIEAAESERESLLNTTQQDATPKVLKHKQLYTCINEQQQQHPCGGSGSGGLGVGAAAGGCESDTNSNCALLVEESNAALMASGGAGAATKTINGNNNYELSEFDNKAHTYR